MRIVTAIVVLLAAGFGLSYITTLGWWLRPMSLELPRLILIAAILVLSVSFWFGSVFSRSRQPRFTVSSLEADNASSMFQMRIENQGPGDIKPIVRVVYLRDLSGRFLEYNTHGFKGPLPISYSGYEAHWRTCPVSERPVLTEKHPFYTGPLAVQGNELLSYSLDGEHVALGSKGLRLQVTASHESVNENTPSLVRHSYLIKPDPSEPLKYKVKRIRFRSLFWR